MWRFLLGDFAYVRTLKQTKYPNGEILQDKKSRVSRATWCDEASWKPECNVSLNASGLYKLSPNHFSLTSKLEANK